MNAKSVPEGIPAVAKLANLHFVRGLLLGGLSVGSAAALIAGVANRQSSVEVIAGAFLCLSLGLTYLFVKSIDGPDTNKF